MRDAFGGAFFIKLMLIFFALYISFIAIALSYTKAFRVKNSIINYIEEHGDYDTAIQDTIDEYVSGMDYYVSSVGPNSSRVQYSTCNSRGYCVFEKASDEVRGKYYEVINLKVDDDIALSPTLTNKAVEKLIEIQKSYQNNPHSS